MTNLSYITPVLTITTSRDQNAKAKDLHMWEVGALFSWRLLVGEAKAQRSENRVLDLKGQEGIDCDLLESER